jgi:hypothetical protein
MALLGYVGVARSTALVMRTDDIVHAHALAPRDGRITALYAQALSGVDATTADRIRADGLARQTLRQDPTAIAAVATLGLDAQIRGDVAGARRLFGYAERLSRRDLRTQIWAIEDAVGRGDVAEALRHYDIALRTSRDASQLLFPIIGSAIVDPPVRAALVGTLAHQPAWASQFVGYAATQGPELQATARLFDDLRRAHVPVSDSASAQLTDRMIGANLLEEAWSYYTTFRPGADRRRARDPEFAGDAETASQFDWRVADNDGITASIQRDGRRGIFDFVAAPSTGGAPLQQMQMLPAGTYRLDWRASGMDQVGDARPYWLLACRDGRELGRVVPASRQASGVFSGRLTVPADCPVQMLSFVVRPSDAAAGTAGQISRVRLVPVAIS